MIVRTWHGCVPAAYGEKFHDHLLLTGVQHSKSIAGNLGAEIRRVVQGEFEHFFLTTWWDSIEAIKSFAGESYDQAVTYADDERYQLISDPLVFHHEVSRISGGPR